VIAGDADGDHVLLEELAEVDAGVEAPGDEIAAAVAGGHVEHDLGEGRSSPASSH